MHIEVQDAVRRGVPRAVARRGAWGGCAHVWGETLCPRLGGERLCAHACVGERDAVPMRGGERLCPATRKGKRKLRGDGAQRKRCKRELPEGVGWRGMARREAVAAECRRLEREEGSVGTASPHAWLGTASPHQAPHAWAQPLPTRAVGGAP